MQRPPIIDLIRRLAANSTLKRIIIVTILVTTVLVFAYYFKSHPEYIRSLRHVSLLLIVGIIGLNVILLLILVAVYDAILRLCGHRLPWKERFMLTSYSSIINFFGPLQSGPGVRAVYLKTKHGVRIRDYTLGTLLYYGMFAFISAAFLLVGTRPLWQVSLVLLAVATFSILVVRYFRGKDRQISTSQFQLRPEIIAWLAFVTFLQVLFVSIVYYLELHSLNAHISYGQAASYTGAANFALFVSLTPGAIGFRETFLYFSQQLHHVTTAQIATANLIDRGAYIVFLLLLFILMLSLHAGERLRITPSHRQSTEPTGDS